MNLESSFSKRTAFILLLMICLSLSVSACSMSSVAEAEETASSSDSREESAMIISIGDRVLPVLWEENASVDALRELCPLTIQMSMYGGFEQVGPIGASLPRDDVQTTTQAGDIVLYSGNQIVVFYGSNSWAYTRLGRIEGMTVAELKELLGNGNVTLTIAADPQNDNSIPDVTLNSGYTMPVIGLGTWTLDNEQAEESVYAALKCGMRLIDTARYYGCEIGVGRGLQRAIDDGIVTREEVFITSKIMPSDYDRAAQGIDDSLSDMSLDYIDLMLIHRPCRYLSLWLRLLYWRKASGMP